MKKDSVDPFWVFIEFEPAEMGLFAEYLDTLEAFLESEAHEYSKRLSELRQQRLQHLKMKMEAARETGRRADPMAFDSFFPTPEEEAVNHGEQLMGRFGTILRRSFLVAVYSSAETHLNSLCRFLHAQCSLEKSLEDVKNTDQSIERAKKYLVEEAKLKFPDSEEWRRLLVYKTIRNCVVHNEGRLLSDNQIIQRYARKGTREKRRSERQAVKQYNLDHPQLLVLFPPASGQSDKDYRPEIILRKGFCEEVITACEDFFQELNRIVYEKLAA